MGLTQETRRVQLTRRTALIIAASSVTPGCLNTGSGPTTPTEPRPPSPGTGTCDPDNVNRPPIVRDANHPPQGYGTKPQELTPVSVADYLADFETAYAWNRILAEDDVITSLGVNTTTPWTPDATGDGFLASSRIETEYSTEEGANRVERVYVASYFVAAGPVYRVETDSESVDPRTHPDRELVQCGSDTKQ